MSRLIDPIEIGDLTLSNRLYRAPLLECAGNGPDAVVPVRGSVFWDMSIVRGEFPGRAWSDPVLCEGGIRGPEIEGVLGSAADAVGMGRPFYAEPRLPARVLRVAEVVCENCNNCIVPQAAGARGVCRTPSVLAERGKLAREGAYET